MSYPSLPLEIREMIALSDIEVFCQLQLVDKELHQFINQNKNRYYDEFDTVKNDTINNVKYSKTITPKGVLHGPSFTLFVNPTTQKHITTKCTFVSGRISGLFEIFVNNSLAKSHWFNFGHIFNSDKEKLINYGGEGAKLQLSDNKPLEYDITTLGIGITSSTLHKFHSRAVNTIN